MPQHKVPFHDLSASLAEAEIIEFSADGVGMALDLHAEAGVFLSFWAASSRTRRPRGVSRDLSNSKCTDCRTMRSTRRSGGGAGGGGGVTAAVAVAASATGLANEYVTPAMIR